MFLQQILEVLHEATVQDVEIRRSKTGATKLS